MLPETTSSGSPTGFLVFHSMSEPPTEHSTQVESDSFRDLWVESLKFYQEQTGHGLLDVSPPLSELMQCTSVHDLALALQDIDSDFGNFRSKNKKIWTCLKSITRIVDISLDAVGGAVDFTGAVPGGRALFVAFGVLLDASKTVSRTYDAIEEVFEEIQAILDRLENHLSSKTQPTDAMRVIYIKILGQIMKLFAIITKHFKNLGTSRGVSRYIPRRLRHYKIALLDDNEISNEIRRLEKLTKIEMSHAIVEIHTHTSNVSSALFNFQLDDAISKWLSPPESSQIHDSKFKARLEGTGGWFTDENSTYSQWKRKTTSMLWIRGKPGSGKSVICSLAIEDLINEPGLAYYYFEFQDPTKCTVYALLSSLIFQLASRSSECGQILRAFHLENSSVRPRPGVSQLYTCLENLLRACPSTFIIIDALDECPVEERHSDLYTGLTNLFEIEGTHWLITSRFEHDIQQGLNPLLSVSSNLDAQKDSVASYVLDLGDIGEHARDIEKYISNGLSKIETWEDKQKLLAKSELTAKADGMFLLASQQLKVLRNTRKVAIRAALATLPTTLNDMYQRILENITPINAPLAHRILQCVAFTSSPFSPQELSEVFAIDFNPNGDFELCPDFREQDPESALISTCSTLVQITNSNSGEKSSRVVQFSHLSVRDYLTSDSLAERVKSYHLEHKSAHLTLAKVCLGTILYSGALAKLPLWSYATRNWLMHANQSGAAESLSPYLRRMLHPSTATSTNWRSELISERSFDPSARALYCSAFLGLETLVSAWLEKSPSTVNGTGGPLGTALCVASHQGHLEIVRMLLANNASVEKVGDHSRTPLHLACRAGYFEVAKVLMENKSSVGAVEENGGSPLHRAAFGGHESIVQMLLDHNADVNLADNNGWTPLHLAAIQTHIHIIEILLNHGTDVDKQNKTKQTPLNAAASVGSTDVVRVLLDRKAKVDTPNIYGRTPLHSTCLFNHHGVAQVLIEHGADVNSLDKDGWAPLHLAAVNGHVETAGLLVENKATIDIPSLNKRVPLIVACSSGHAGVARYLLEHGAAVDAPDKFGKTPLYDAALKGHKDVFELLIKHKADVGARNNNGWTPLHAAAANGHTEIIRIFLELQENSTASIIDASSKDHGDDPDPVLERANTAVDALDKTLRTPLQVSCSEGRTEAARMLLQYHANINAADRAGNVSLHFAAMRGHVGVARLLIEQKASTDMRNWDKKTPLTVASSLGRTEIVQALLDAGAEVDDVDGMERTPLHYASLGGHLATVRLLLERQAAVDAKGKDGCTPLHLACTNNRTEVAQLLIEHGATIDAQSNIKRTPLIIAADRGNVDVVRLLVEKGADIDATDDLGKTALSCAEAKHKVVADFLRSFKPSGESREKEKDEGIDSSKEDKRDDTDDANKQ